MKILSILTIIFLFFSTANAYFIENKNYQNDLNVLINLDIDATYIRNSDFLKVKDSSSHQLYQQHLYHALQEEYNNVVLLQDLLKNEHVPAEILYLAVVESGLKNKIKSKKGAAGIWQLMPTTAKSLGLRVDHKIDERLDPVASTKAAVQYLTKLKNRFGKWYLAILAYNCGQARLNKAILEAGSDDLNILLDPQKAYLNKETRYYLYKILLTAQMANNLDDVMQTDLHLFNNPNELKLANLNMKNFSLQSKITQYSKKQKNKIYIVKQGDTFTSISKKFDVSIKTLMDVNNKKNSKLAIGDRIVISN